MESVLAILSSLVPGLGDKLGKTVGGIEKDLARPGALPAGRFQGSLMDGDDAVPVTLDFTRAEPLMALGESRYLLQAVEWERGTLQAKAVGSLPLGAGKGRWHSLLLTLWTEQGELHGIGMEQLDDARPRFGVPHFLRLSPVP